MLGHIVQIGAFWLFWSIMGGFRAFWDVLEVFLGGKFWVMLEKKIIFWAVLGHIERVWGIKGTLGHCKTSTEVLRT